MYDIIKEAKGLVAHGVSACAGCGLELVIRNVLDVLGEDTVILIPPGCSALFCGFGNEGGMKIGGFQNNLENTAAMAAGVRVGLDAQGNDHTTVLAFAGDGATADIGLQSFSGMVERGDRVLYICYDNEAYMNTGIQRSSSTPHFSDTTTSPAGSVIPGKQQNKKDLTKIIAAHNIPYVAQTTFIGNFRDLSEKARKALYTPGAAFLNVMAPCPRGWRYPTEDLMEICKLAVESCVWPLFEVEDGKWTLNYEPKNKLPVEDYLRPQGRFKHMFAKGNEWMIEEVQKEVDRKWEELKALCGK